MVRDFLGRNTPWPCGCLLALASVVLACEESPPQPPTDADVLHDYDVEHYALRGRLEWQAREFQAEVEIRLRVLDPKLTTVTLSSAVQVKKVEILGHGEVPFTATTDELAIDLDSLDRALLQRAVTVRIEYLAPASEGLRVVDQRTLDPLSGRVFFTNSEPLQARLWLPCHNLPADRATLSVTLNLAADEDMVGNGVRGLETVTPEGRRELTYAIDQPIANYVMAFAAGHLERHTKATEGLKVEVWARPNLPFDANAVLDDLERQAKILQAKLGNYAFDRYALVFLPDFSGGMENASVTFQGETQGSYPSLAGDKSLNAHELAHQWFGDQVTVRTWDDLWIKEGLATHLDAETARAYIDRSHANTYLGSRFGAVSNEAVFDQEKAPAEKYDSGPYARAAWLLGQIRASIGDEKFFANLREVLRRYHFSSVDTAGFLAVFAEDLGSSRTTAVRNALVAQAVPKIAVTVLDGDHATITIDDLDHAMVLPLELSWFDPNGEVEKLEVAGNDAIDLQRPTPLSFLVIDPRDVHPYRSFFGGELGKLAALRLLSDKSQLPVYLNLPGAVHETTIDLALPVVQPAAFGDFVGQLNSETAFVRASEAACRLALAASGDVQVAWVSALTQHLRATPPAFALDGQVRLSACSQIVDPATFFADDLTRLRTAMATFAAERDTYVAKFDFPDEIENATWPFPVLNAAAMRLRRIALAHLVRRSTELEAPLDQSIRLFFRMLAREADPLELGRNAVNALATSQPADAAADPEDLATLAIVLSDPDRLLYQTNALCAAYALMTDPEAEQAEQEAEFRAWVSGLPQSGWSEGALAIAADPGKCD